MKDELWKTKDTLLNAPVVPLDIVGVAHTKFNRRKTVRKK